MSSIVRSSNIFSTEPIQIVDWEFMYNSMYYLELDILFNTDLNQVLGDYSGGTNAISVEIWEYDTTIGESTEAFLAKTDIVSILQSNDNLSSSNLEVVQPVNDLVVNNNKMSVLFDESTSGNHISPQSVRSFPYYDPTTAVSISRNVFRTYLKVKIHEGTDREIELSSLDLSLGYLTTTDNTNYFQVKKLGSPYVIAKNDTDVSSSSGTSGFMFGGEYLNENDKLVYSVLRSGDVPLDIMVSDTLDTNFNNRYELQVDNNGANRTVFRGNRYTTLGSFNFRHNYNESSIQYKYQWENHTNQNIFGFYLDKENRTDDYLYPWKSIANINSSNDYEINNVEIASTYQFENIQLTYAGLTSVGTVTLYHPLLENLDASADGVSGYIKFKNSDLNGINNHTIDFFGSVSNGRIVLKLNNLPITTSVAYYGGDNDTSVVYNNTIIEMYVGHNVSNSIDNNFEMFFKLPTSLSVILEGQGGGGA